MACSQNHISSVTLPKPAFSILSHEVASLFIILKNTLKFYLRLPMRTQAKTDFANNVVDHSGGLLSLANWEQPWLWCLFM